MHKKTLIIILSMITLILTSAVSVYAWFQFDKGTSVEEYEVIMDSRRLISANMNVTYKGQMIQYNSTSFNKNTLMFELVSPTIGTANPNELLIDLYVNAHKDVRFRAKIIEQWKNSSGKIIYPPQNITYNYNTSAFNLVNGWYEYNSILNRNLNSTAVTPIRLTNSVVVPSSISSYRLSITVYIEAKQASQSNASWSTGYEVDEYLISGSAVNKIAMVFSNISTPYFTRGVVIEIQSKTSSNIRYTYVYNENSINDEIQGISSSTYKIKVYLPETIEYDIYKNGSTLYVETKYRKMTTFIGIQDFIYSPSMIQSYVHGTTYQVGNIVLFQGEYYIMVNGPQANVNPTNSWFWKKLGAYYQSGTTYKKGDVVYNTNTKKFYVSNYDNNGSDITQSWWWTPIGINYVSGIQYQQGDVYFYEEHQTYYQANRTGNTSIGTPYNSWWWTQINIDDPIRQWQAGHSYAVDYVVVYENQLYIWTGNGSDLTSIPGSEKNGWNQITDNWVYSNIYATGEFVIYNGSLWKALQNPGNIAPGQDFTVWEELRLYWIADR